MIPRSYPFLALILLGLFLYLPGINWGLPGLVSWSQDSIAGIRTLGATVDWPHDWKGRYPPLHYGLLRAAYEPVLRHWHANGAAEFDPATGRYSLAAPQAPKVGTLILIARLLSVVMAIGAGLSLYVAGRRLLHHDLAAALAAAAFMAGADFTYFAHLDNVDVPSLFWFALSLVFFARLLDHHRIRDAALLGLFGSLAISTKDSVAGVYPGLAACLLMERMTGRARCPTRSRSHLKSLLQPHWVMGILCFILPYLFLNGAFHNWEAYVSRMNYWLSPPPEALHAQQGKYASPLHLMVATVHYAASAAGWPMLTALVAGLAYAAVHRPRLCMIAALPALTYHLIIIMPQGFVYARFLSAPLALLCLPLGAATTAFLRRRDWSVTGRAVIFACVALPSLGYAVAVNAELRSDSRYAAESWFQSNVQPPSSVGAFAPAHQPALRPQYLPRMHEMGYATYPVVMSREWLTRPQPQFLILDSFTYEDFDAGQRACMQALFDGEFGYRIVAVFTGRFLPDQHSWLSIAGWGTPALGKISPRLTILERVP